MKCGEPGPTDRVSRGPADGPHGVLGTCGRGMLGSADACVENKLSRRGHAGTSLSHFLFETTKHTQCFNMRKN